MPMNVIHIDHTKIPASWPPSVMALGKFDGLHIGHRQIVSEAVAIAEEHGLIPSIMTFDPHPRAVLGGGFPFNLALTPLPKQLELFEKMGVQQAVVVHFTREFAAMGSESFVQDILHKMNVQVVVAGFDYRFGAGGKATVHDLQEIARSYQIATHVVPAVIIEGQKVSSTLVREQILAGNISEVTKFLGRRYEIEGTVIHGEKRGRTLGFPTANILPSFDYLIPKKGVYLVEVTLPNDHRKAYGVLNIGVKPTFHNDNQGLSIEVHILDYVGDLYDQTLQVEFIDFIRDEQAFSSIQYLVDQIHKDIQFAQMYKTI